MPSIIQELLKYFDEEDIAYPDIKVLHLFKYGTLKVATIIKNTYIAISSMPHNSIGIQSVVYGTCQNRYNYYYAG